MTRKLGKTAALAGIALGAGGLAIAAVAAGYLTTNPVALAVTLLIAAFYGLGAAELRRFHQATRTLSRGLAQAPVSSAELDSWLGHIDPTLRTPVRLRIDGERVGLPGPALTPYLVGLLVLLGMLGTFLGMVVTLHGAAGALQSSADLPAIRAALTAPVQGLGLAFGTSLAGVAGSAMLGLLSALCRRERLQAAQQLDTACATQLRACSRAHQAEQRLAQWHAQAREDTRQTQQLQAQVLPQLLSALQGLSAQLAQVAQSTQQGSALNAQLLAGQDCFHRGTQALFGELAASVGTSLQRSLDEGARLATATLAPSVQATMTGLAQQAAAVQVQLTGSLEAALDALDARFEQRSTALLTDLAASEQRRLSDQTRLLADFAAELQAQAQAQARDTLAEIAGLMQAAAEAPRVAAEVIGQLREQLTGSLVRDNELLAERSATVTTLQQLLDSVHHAATAQRTAIDTLVASSAEMLGRAGTQLSQTIEAETARIGDVAAQLGSSAVEVASLGEAFTHAVERFDGASHGLVAQLQAIEGALAKSTARSDEQLGYYVAQAREIIDLSISSQQQIVEDLRRWAGRQTALAAEAV
jgi:hypothetical protein